MSSKEIIAKIKAEIERRIVYAIGFRDNVEQEERASFFNGEAVALKNLLPFLSTLEVEEYVELSSSVDNYPKNVCPPSVECEKGMREPLESEKPMEQNDELNDEIKRFVAEYGYERSNDILLIAIVARHFAEWGYLRAAEKYNEIEYNRQIAEEHLKK